MIEKNVCYEALSPKETAWLFAKNCDICELCSIVGLNSINNIKKVNKLEHEHISE